MENGEMENENENGWRWEGMIDEQREKERSIKWNNREKRIYLII